MTDITKPFTEFDQAARANDRSAHILTRALSAIELELALIEGLAKVREIGMKQTEEEDESVV